MTTPDIWHDPEYRARLADFASRPVTRSICVCGHDRDNHGRWPSMPGAEDWACWLCGCEEWR